MDNQFPFTFGKYRMEAEIGRGGFGTVFRAVDIALDRPVAIKIMDPVYMRDQRWVARFRREARVMARLDHPHIVTVHEIGEENGRLFIAMKLVNGPDLTQYIRNNGPLPWGMVLSLSEQIASALDYAHQQNIVHRDLKPGNVLISHGNVLLTDFGLAQMLESNSQSISVSGGFAGTYNYMPPEIFNNEPATAAADVYALGCVIYEMITGEVLIEGDSTAAIIGSLLKGVTLDHPLGDEIPAGINEVIQTALAKNPNDRYASAGELAAELSRVASDRFAEPYTQLLEALETADWATAVALAGQISDQDPNYRDIATLEAQAKRGQWSQQWREEAQRGLDEADYDLVRGALIQWRRVDPQHPDVAKIEKELALAEDYAALQALITAGKWPGAKSAALAIAAQDPNYRDLPTLQARINTRLATAEPAITPSPKRTAPLPQKKSTRSSTIPAGTPKAPGPKKKEERKFPLWVWIVGIPLVACILLFIITLNSFNRPDDIEATPVVEELLPPNAGLDEGVQTPLVNAGAGVTQEKEATPVIEEKPAALPFEGHLLTLWADEIRAPVLDRMAGDFQAQTGAELIVEEIPITDLQAQFIASSSVGGGPDLIAGPHDWIGPFWESGLIAPLEIGGLESDFHDGAISAFTYNDGLLYGLPYIVENAALCYNTGALNTAPETWADVLEMSSELSEAVGGAPVFMLPSRIYFTYPFHTAFGGYIFGQNSPGGYDITDVGMDNGGFIESAYFLQEMVSRGLINPNATYDESLSQFASDRAGFIITGPWDLPALLEQGAPFQCIPFPDNGRSFLGVQGIMINAQSQNRELAQAFLAEFLVNEAPMHALAEATERPSAYLPLFHAIEEGHDLYGFAQASLNADPIPANPEMALVWEPWDQAMLSIFSFALTPEEALSNAANVIREQVDLGGIAK